MSGALLLNAYPERLVTLACTKCERKGQYLKGNLILKYGANISLPHLLAKIADCKRATEFQGCGAHYTNLVKR